MYGNQLVFISPGSIFQNRHKPCHKLGSTKLSKKLSDKWDTEN